MIKHYAVIVGEADKDGVIKYEIDHQSAFKLGGVAFDETKGEWITPTGLWRYDRGEEYDAEFVMGIYKNLVKEDWNEDAKEGVGGSS
jgi:hypothetical protein